MEHATMLLPVVARRQQGPKQHVRCMYLKMEQRVADGFVEGKTSNDSSQIPASTNKCRHHGQLLLFHERHNSVACALCHLDKQGEENKHCQCNVPWLGVVHQSEAEQEDCFKEQRQELRPNTASKTKVLEEDVTGNSSQRPGKEIHQAEGSGQRRGITCIHLEVSPEVRRQLVVHRQLCAEASGILP